MIKVEARIKKDNLRKIQSRIKAEGRAIVVKHALAAASVAYQLYPVGPPHKDGTPHTRDTITIIVDGIVVGTEGNFTFSGQSGKEASFKSFTVSMLTRGASFFVEFGTIYMDPRPILRMVTKQARADIANELRTINVSVTQGV